MKVCFSRLLLAVCFAATVSFHVLADEPANQKPRRLRVLTYNIHHGEGTDGVGNLKRIAAVIRKAQPDLVALQEVDNKVERSGGVDQVARLAELTGLEGRFAKQMDFQGGDYGQAFLSRFPLSDVTVHWLPGHPERQRRIAATVTIQFQDRPLTFVSTHLHHFDDSIRTGQAEMLNTLFAERPEPVILAGDFNAVPDSETLAILQRHWACATGDNVLTFPSSIPSRQLDYILYRPAGRFRVLSATVLDEPIASDHRPLLVELAGE